MDKKLNKSATLHIRVTPLLMRQIAERGQKHGLNPSAFARLVLVEHLGDGNLHPLGIPGMILCILFLASRAKGDLQNWHDMFGK